MTQQPWDDLVTTEWLARHQREPGVKIVDATFKMPGVLPIAQSAYLAAHISGAVFFDIDEIADHGSNLPHMLPSAEEFAQKVGQLGLGDTDYVIVYDSAGLVGATRAWWSFKVFGHDRVAVLDGGLIKWLAEDRPVDGVVPSPKPARFSARYNPALVRSREQVLANVTSRAEQVLDARANPRFDGRVAEPRAGLRQGHIPGSYNLDHATLLDPHDGTLKQGDALKQLFDQAGVDLSRPIVTSCGSGISATALAFALERLGRPGTPVYDGSWAEWGLPGELPIEITPE